MSAWLNSDLRSWNSEDGWGYNAGLPKKQASGRDTEVGSAGAGRTPKKGNHPDGKPRREGGSRRARRWRGSQGEVPSEWLGCWSDGTRRGCLGVEGSAGGVEKIGGYGGQHWAFLKDKFAKFADLGGSMAKEQLQNCLYSVGLRPTRDQLALVWRSIGGEGRGKITQQDFVRSLGEIVVAAGFPKGDEAGGAEMADFKTVYGATNPSADSERGGHDQRVAFMQSRVSSAAALNALLVEKLQAADVARDVLRLEIKVLKPYQEKSVDLQGRLDAETRRADALEVEKNALCEENMVCRQLIAQLGGDLGLLPERTAAFSREQEALIDELQQQVRELSMPDERYQRLEERVEYLTRQSSDLLEKCEASEGLLQSILQVNQNMVQQQEEHLASIQRLRDQLDAAQGQTEALRWELVAARGESEALSALVQGAEECVKLMREKGQGEGETGEGGEHRDGGDDGGGDDGGGDDAVAAATRAVDDWLESVSFRGGKWADVSEVCDLKAEISELREMNHHRLISLRVAERNTDSLAEANGMILRQYMTAVVVEAAAASSGLERKGVGAKGHLPPESPYSLQREQAEFWNQLCEPKVGPGSKTEKTPNWLFSKDSALPAQNGGELRGLAGHANAWGGGATPQFGQSSHEAIALWLQQYRSKMKQASVRFLASQDGQVLGADLYTQSAFDKLIKRAGAITDDMMREAHLLRSKENLGNELAHQLSLLLEDMVESTCKMNTLAAVVHQVMLRKIHSMRDAGPGAGAEGDSKPRDLSSRLLGALGGGDNVGGVDGGWSDDGLLSLATLSGVLGELSPGGFLAGQGKTDADRMRDLLARIDQSSGTSGVDHRQNGVSTRNASSQMSRAQRQVQHNTLFGLMTSRLANSDPRDTTE